MTEARIKKAYVEIIDFLEANGDKKVKTIIADVIKLVAAKGAGGGGGITSFHKNEAGDVVAIRDYYFQLWISPGVVEFGAKASSPTGLNNMCKEGVSNWTKQQRVARVAKEDLLGKIASEEIPAKELPAELAKIEEARGAVALMSATPETAEGETAPDQVHEEGYGFATLEECQADNQARGLPH